MLKMSLETCPFCGKPFKRLKSHLPHCKMFPKDKTNKIMSNPKVVQTTGFKHTSYKVKMNVHSESNYQTLQANSDSKVKSRSKEAENMSMDQEFLQNPSFTLTSTASNVRSPEKTNTDHFQPKTKSLRKRDQEMLKRDEPQCLVSPDKHVSKNNKSPVITPLLLDKEITRVEKKLRGTSLTSQLTSNMMKSTISDVLESNIQDKQCVSKCKEIANVSKQIRNSPKPSDTESRIKEHKVTVFNAKTCVWDHIKHGLYNRRHGSISVRFPITSAHNLPLNNSESVLEPCTGNSTMKTFPVGGTDFQTSVQIPVEDMLSSQLQKKPVFAYFPEKTHFSSSQSEFTTDNNLVKRCQELSSQSQGLPKEQRLGDVRLNQLASWLAARATKSPREAMTIFNKGWQWYYRKYIDVQKGGIGGIAMLIGGLCVLSYIWNYPNIKKERWRKYH